MKDIFSEYYSDNNKSEKEIWETAIICLDSNVMLELYRMPEETRNSYFEVFEQIKGRVIIPYQAMKKFFNNRFNVIENERMNYESVLNDLMTSLRTTETNYVAKFRNPVAEIEEFLKEIRGNVENTSKKIKVLIINKIPSYFDDHILVKLTDLFQNRIHKAFEVEKLEEFYENGNKKYREKCSLDYKDVNKSEEKQYEDYIIWEEMINISFEEKKPIIFISNNKKGNWRHGRETSQVRHELLEEFRKRAGYQFFMYKLEEIPEKVKTYLETEIKDFEDKVHRGYEDTQDIYMKVKEV